MLPSHDSTDFSAANIKVSMKHHNLGCETSLGWTKTNTYSVFELGEQNTEVFKRVVVLTPLQTVCR